MRYISDLAAAVVKWMPLFSVKELVENQKKIIREREGERKWGMAMDRSNAANSIHMFLE